MAAISFKCPNCDGELIFDPKIQAYKCEYCGSDFSQAQLDALNPAESKEQQEDFAEEPEKAEWSAEQYESTREEEQKKAEEKCQEETERILYYTCPSCGAEVVTEKTTAATFCYYCHNPIILDNEVKGNYHPDGIIPFKIEKKHAEQCFLDYVKSRKFVPKNFFSKKQIESMSGVYFPYWLYDAEYQGEMHAEGRTIRTWVVRDEQFTETKVYDVERRGRVELQNLSTHALRKANVKLAESVFPYNFNEWKPFSAGFLSGFLAERRDVEQSEVEVQMKQEMSQHAARLMKNSIEGYQNVEIRSSHFDVVKDEFKYVLLPTWSITYKGKNGKVYYYSMNGQTGNICGELPIDYKKLTMVSIVVGLVAFALTLVGGYFLW